MRKFEMTKAEMFAEFIALAEIAERADLVAMANHELELLAKKASRTSKKSDINEQLADEILPILRDAEISEVTCTELVALVAHESIKSTSKMSAVLRKLIDRGDVIREQVGKKVTFSLA